MSKIRTKRVVFFYDKYVNSTIMVDSFYWNYIGSWIQLIKFIVGVFSKRPILDPKFPLMRTNPQGPPTTPVSDPEEILRRARASLRQTSSAAKEPTSGISRIFLLLFNLLKHLNS